MLAVRRGLNLFQTQRRPTSNGRHSLFYFTREAYPYSPMTDIVFKHILKY